MKTLALLVSAALAGAATAQDQALPAVGIAKGADAVEVTLGGEPFATYHFGGEKARAKPLLYPIHGPSGAPMLRDFPFKKDTPGEAHDHPHHEGLWYTHGDVNGISFWHVGDNTGTIRHKRFLDGAADEIATENEWLSKAGEPQLTDETRIRFFALPGGGRGLDYSVTLKATHGDVTFGDTKEGSMGIRTHAALRLKGEVATGQAINANGETGPGIWGKNAAWVYYWGKVGEAEVGVGIFDHPSNPRHPTTWHARDYGLIAANPFGIHDFKKQPAGTGDLIIKAGDEVSFRYAFVFLPGDPEAAGVAETFERWAAE